MREKGPVEEEGMVGRNGRRRRVSRDRVKLGELGVELGLVERLRKKVAKIYGGGGGEDERWRRAEEEERGRRRRE